MTGIEMIIGIIICLAVFLAIIFTVSFIIIKSDSKKYAGRNVYLGKLANSDLSIQEAMKYLKLTNGINQTGEDK